jgi:hypothetical protein
MDLYTLLTIDRVDLHMFIDNVHVRLIVSKFVMKPVKQSDLFIVIHINKRVLGKN